MGGTEYGSSPQRSAKQKAAQYMQAFDACCRHAEPEVQAWLENLDFHYFLADGSPWVRDNLQKRILRSSKSSSDKLLQAPDEASEEADRVLSQAACFRPMSFGILLDLYVLFVFYAATGTISSIACSEDKDTIKVLTFSASSVSDLSSSPATLGKLALRSVSAGVGSAGIAAARAVFDDTFQKAMDVFGSMEPSTKEPSD